MEHEHETVKQVRDELARHRASGDPGPFHLSQSSSSALLKLTRALETKRQTGNLTESEQTFIKQSDELWENVVRSGEAKNVPPPAAGPKTYDLKTKRLFEEPDKSAKISKLVTPAISVQEADQIIETLNQQFEEKVMKEIRQSRGLQANEEPKVPGKNLQDYLSTFRAGIPEVPFAGEDSQIDLSKLAKKSN